MQNREGVGRIQAVDRLKSCQDIAGLGVGILVILLGIHGFSLSIARIHGRFYGQSRGLLLALGRYIDFFVEIVHIVQGRDGRIPLRYGGSLPLPRLAIGVNLILEVVDCRIGRVGIHYRQHDILGSAYIWSSAQIRTGARGGIHGQRCKILSGIRIILGIPHRPGQPGHRVVSLLSDRGVGLGSSGRLGRGLSEGDRLVDRLNRDGCQLRVVQEVHGAPQATPRGLLGIG